MGRKPDPDFMRISIGHAADALDAIGRFQTSVGFAFGRDGTHSATYHSVRNLADELQSIAAKLNHAALAVDERLTPAARMTTDTKEDG